VEEAAAAVALAAETPVADVAETPAPAAAEEKPKKPRARKKAAE
jgi:hypothetical protein